MDKTPQFIQLAFGHMEILPVGHHHQPTLPGGAIQPRADGIFVTLNNPRCRVDGVALRQRAHRQFKWVQLVLFKAPDQAISLLSMSCCFDQKDGNRF